MPRSPSGLSAVVLLGALFACRPAESGAHAAVDGEATNVLMDARIRVPVRWAGHYRLDTLSTQERGSALPGALEYYYHPSVDTTIPEQVLAVVAVYDSAAWAAARAEGGPPPGDSVTARAGRVYIVGLPQSNPYAGGTPDSARFDTLQLTRAELGAFLSVP